MSTNGTLLNNEMKEWFSAHSDKFVLGLSFDGNEEMQNMNRTNSASQVDVDFFVNTWPEQPAKATISKATLPKLADGIISMHNAGFKNIQSNLAFGVDWKEADYKEYVRQLELLVDYYVSHPDVKPCSLLDIELMSALSFSNHDSKVCGCGDGTICIDVDGKNYPCQMFAPISCDRFTYVMDFKDPTNFIVDKCRKCLLNKICPKCYGMNYLVSGKVNEQPNSICRMFKIQFLMNCEMKRRILIRNPNFPYADGYRNLLNLITQLFKISYNGF